MTSVLKSQTLPHLDTIIEEGLTVKDVMVMAAEDSLIKVGALIPIPFDEAFSD